IPSSAKPKIATGFATKSATIRRKGVCPALAAAIASAFCFRQPDPWIERRIQDVDQELAHARPGEDALGDDGESDQEAELQPDHGDDWDQDVAQHVHADHPPV